MTEDEAKEKWCPHARVVWTSGNGPANRDMETKGEWPDTFPDFAKQTSCIGSKCMMWRWVRALAVFEEDPDLSAYVNTDKGYCGLAGAPS